MAEEIAGEVRQVTFSVDGPFGRTSCEIPITIPPLPTVWPTKAQTNAVEDFYQTSAKGLSESQCSILLNAMAYARALSEDIFGPTVWDRDLIARIIAAHLLSDRELINDASYFADSAFASEPDKPPNVRRRKRYPRIKQWIARTIASFEDVGITVAHLRQKLDSWEAQ